jgi:transposase
MKFEEVYERTCRAVLSSGEAAEVLGVSERTFRRWRGRFEAEGAEGLYDRRLGRASARRAPVDEVARVLDLHKTRYKGFTTKHFHEKLVNEHGFGLSYNWLRLTLQAHGRVTPAPRRGAHRRKRPRRPMVGMMLHQDGSSHEWVPGRIWDLIVTLDDATSEIYAASFVDEEGTMSSFQALHQVIAEHGLFCALYADRGSHYWHTPEAGGKVDKDNPTQVGRALAQLGIELIAAYSPQARGRSERMFATLQDRLPKELALAGITTMAEANRFLEEVYLPQHNARFARPAEDVGSAFVPFTGPLEDILCIQEERVVGNDNTVRYNNRILQIPADRHRHHYVKVRVRVHEYPDGTLAVFHGPRCLARYAPEGEPITKVEQPGGVNRSDVAKACGYDGQRQAVAHIPTDPTTTTEAVNSSVT